MTSQRCKECRTRELTLSGLLRKPLSRKVPYTVGQIAFSRTAIPNHVTGAQLHVCESDPNNRVHGASTLQAVPTDVQQ
jgi:hypothetical protein